MRCRCDDVGPELMECPRCDMAMTPVGRDGGAGGPSYCDCEHTMDFGEPEWLEHAKATQRRSSLWPGERWGNSLPCIGDACVAVAKKDEVE